MAGLSSLLKNAFPKDFLNGTGSDTATLTASIPASVLEAFLPGYGGVTRFIHQLFGFDITIFVSAGVVIWLLCKIGNYLYESICRLVAENFMCSINISSMDDIYIHLMKWLADQDSIKNSRSLMAETTFSKAWDGEDEEGDGAVIDDDSDDEINFLNFSNQEAKAPPRFIPHFGSHRFWWKKNLFLLHRVQKAVLDLGSMPAVKDQEVLTLTCFGRSAQPIKSLLQAAKDFYLLDHSEKTVIRRPSGKDMRRYGGRHCWVQIADRPCRPMETVVLDHKRKREVLRDINEYLHPATPRWYANRGIPYRRGYLFHGPPGTGKTSLSFALAGVFGLDIYVISLLEPTLTEEDLGQLFNALPRRCVVLLEDIDTAGLVRPDKNKIEDTKGSSTSKATESGVADLVKALKKANETTDEDKKKGISLSGLLNAIDGVASHEGRVLVMTTNKPEALDDALIRPGRVDLQVAFGNATQEQIRELFERMYTSVAKKKADKAEKPSTGVNSIISFPSSLMRSSKPSAQLQDKAPESERLTPAKIDKILTPPTTPTNEKSATFIPPLTDILPKDGFKKKERAKRELSKEELKEIAASFASKIPDGKFSPAEIQGFLLKRKRDPRKADDEIERWVQAMIELKKNESKVLDVQ